MIGLASLGFLALLLSGDQVPRIRDTAQRPVVLATTPCVGDQDAGATGMLIGDETVITVAHAVVDANDVFVRDRSLQWWASEVRHVDRDRDLALLSVPGLRATDMAVATAQRGEQVTMLGGLTSGTASGEVMRRVVINTNSIGSEIETERRGYELALDIERGDSGAAVVDGDGRLVGVIFAQSSRRAGVAWATDLSAVPDVLGSQSSFEPPC